VIDGRGRAGQPVGQRLEVGDAEARDPRQEVRDRRQERRHGGSGEPEQQGGRHRGERRQVGQQRDERHRMEVGEEQRRHAELRRQRGPGGHGDRPGQEREAVGQRPGQGDHAGGRRHAQLEPDRPHEVRVRHQQHEHGRAQQRRGAARPPQQRADQGEPGHDAGPQDRRLGAGQDDEEHHGAQPEQEPPARRQSEEHGQAEHRRQHHRHVLPGDRHEVAEPGRPEVLLVAGVEVRRVAE
jgi:hypothetical protein